MRKLVSVLVVVGCLAIVVVMLRPALTHRFYVKTYLRNSQGIHPGTSVRVDGVEIGSVKSITIKPELKDQKVEVLMALDDAVSHAIPADSSVLLSAEGVLGPTVLDIDTTKTSAPPVENYGFLTSDEVADDQAAKALEKVGNVLIDEAKKLRKTQPTR